MSPTFLWRKAVGPKGATVSAIERTAGRFYLRWWEATREGRPGRWRLESITATDRDDAIAQALQLSRALVLAEEDAAGTAPPTLGRVLARYTAEVSAHKKPPQPSEDARRAALWLAFFGEGKDVRRITKADLGRFVTARRAGKIQAKQWRTVNGERALVPIKLAPKPKDTTIGADVIYLQAVCNWAVEAGLLDKSPIAKWSGRPQTANPARPVATYDRFLALREHCDAVHPRFGAFMDLIESLGWRESAICQLRGTDIDRTTAPTHPHGRILKRADADKEGVEGWVPLPETARRAVDALAVVGDAWLFPAPRRRGQPWSRWYARDLLERAERAAGLSPLAGGDFHPYRRKWATERKHLPTPDVMAAGAWKDRRSLETAYQQVDPKTLLDVMTETRKLRERAE